jgi:hypothetical protein
MNGEIPSTDHPAQVEVFFNFHQVRLTQNSILEAALVSLDWRLDLGRGPASPWRPNRTARVGPIHYG